MNKKDTQPFLSRNKRGFTLIETMIAILILSIAIAGPLTIAAKGLNAALIAKNQTIAFYLAQDAIEYLHFERDTTCLSQLPATCSASTWLSTKLSNCVSSNGTVSCYFDSTNNTPSSPQTCASGGCPVLDYTPSTAMYNYDTTNGSPTIFTRTVQIITPISGETTEATASTTVSWNDVGGIKRSVTVQEELFDWQ